MKRRQIRKIRAKKRRIRKVSLIFIAIVLALLGYGGYFAFQTLQAANKTYNDLNRAKSDLRDEEVSISKDPISILIMGVENYQSDNDRGRTDTLMVATFNPDEKNLQLLSIPRDTLVEIVGRGIEDKINHAYAFGGKEMTINTVENFLDIPIDYYATVNFEAFKNVVDILGGITVEVPFDFEQNSDDRKAEKLQFYEGEMELDGRYALAYARMRMADPRGDIGRNERQQQVIKAIIKKALSPTVITKVDDLIQEVGRNVETNMHISEGLAFFNKYSDFNVDRIEQLKLETYPERINGIHYQIADENSLEEVKYYLKKHLELDVEKPEFLIEEENKDDNFNEHNNAS
jgi:LCP family protein required for cell wall assembly